MSAPNASNSVLTGSQNRQTLFSIEDCENLEITEVWKLYSDYVNPGQVSLISSFGFGRDLVDHAQGAWIYTKSGRKILDFTGGIGVLNHGHNHPRILHARQTYEKLNRMEVHKNFFSPYVAGLSHNIAQLLPGDLKISYFPNSGAEAVEGAIKMAYKYHGGTRSRILSADISFHGKLLGSASVTGSPELHFTFPQIPGTEKFTYNSRESVQQLVDSLRKPNGESDIYALLVEPLNGSSVRACSDDFLYYLRDICSQHDIILIFDEVYTGWAKTGYLFNFMRTDVVPDILTMAKSFGGGKASISGFVARVPVFHKAYGTLHDATLHSTTYNAFGEETITAIEAINIIVDDNYVSRAKHIFEKLNPGLRALQERYPNIIAEVRGSGALNGILLKVESSFLSSLAKLVRTDFFKDERFLNKVATAAVIDEMYHSHGVLTFYGSNREIPLIISPSLIVTDEEIDLFLTALDKTLEQGLVKLCAKFVKNKFLRKL